MSSSDLSSSPDSRPPAETMTQEVIQQTAQSEVQVEQNVKIPDSAPNKTLRRMALANLIATLLVILWGAVVRATGSGAGCGDHWPRCNGEIIPSFKQVSTMIEFTHRAMTGIWLAMIVGTVVLVYRSTPKKSLLRKSATVMSAFAVIECLIGAALVLFKLVGHDTSSNRAAVMAIHHLNTAILLGVVTLMCYWAYGGAKIRLQNQGAAAGGLAIGMVALLATIVSGAITALGDTLFKAQSSAHALERALTPTAHFLEKLRVAHPIISISTSLFILLFVGQLLVTRKSAHLTKFGRWTMALIGIQVIHGALNVAMKAPVYMQIIHLAIADVLLIAYVLTSAVALSANSAETVSEAQEEPVERLKGRDAVRAYIALTKPRVISLLLFTTLLAMFIAAKGWPGGGLLFWVAIGGYFAAGAANAINMVIDSDIDVRMKRTSTRPTVTRQIPASHAMIFALTLATLSCVMLTLAANALTAVLAMAGLLFYVFIYTLLLKRRTWQNIVIGGAAGSFPPLVGWAAVTGELSPLAWFLFALIFFWTPVHFWALALLIKDDYAEAGIPMLPVVHGERATVVQITVYAILTALLCFVPVMLGTAGLVYVATALLLNAILVLRSWQLMNQPDRPKAVRLFKYSMVYLALFFVMMAIDQANRGILLG